MQHGPDWGCVYGFQFFSPLFFYKMEQGGLAHCASPSLPTALPPKQNALLHVLISPWRGEKRIYNTWQLLVYWSCGLMCNWKSLGYHSAKDGIRNYVEQMGWIFFLLGLCWFSEPLLLTESLPLLLLLIAFLINGVERAILYS